MHRIPRATLALGLVATMLLSACGDDDTTGAVEPEPDFAPSYVGLWEMTVSQTDCEGNVVGQPFDVTLPICAGGETVDVLDFGGNGLDGQFFNCGAFVFDAEGGKLTCNALVTDVAFLDCVFDYQIEVDVVRVDANTFAWTARLDWAPVEGCTTEITTGCLVQTGTATRNLSGIPDCAPAPITGFDYSVAVGPSGPAFETTESGVAAELILGRAYVTATDPDEGRTRFMNFSLPLARGSDITVDLIALPEDFEGAVPSDQAVLFYLDRREVEGEFDPFLATDFTGTMTVRSTGRDVVEVSFDGNGTLEALTGDVRTESFSLDGGFRVPARVVALPAVEEGSADLPVEVRSMIDRSLRAVIEGGR